MAEPKPIVTVAPATIIKKNTIVVNDTKRLAEIAAGSKAAAAKGGIHRVSHSLFSLPMFLMYLTENCFISLNFLFNVNFCLVSLLKIE